MCSLNNDFLSFSKSIIKYMCDNMRLICHVIIYRYYRIGDMDDIFVSYNINIFH